MYLATSKSGLGYCVDASCDGVMVVRLDIFGDAVLAIDVLAILVRIFVWWDVPVAQIWKDKTVQSLSNIEYA